MIEMGIIVALGFLVTLWKCPWKLRLKVLNYPLTADICTFLLLTVIHWGTFSGVMVATVGALACSLVFTVARWLIGYINKNTYHPGVLNMSHKI